MGNFYSPTLKKLVLKYRTYEVQLKDTDGGAIKREGGTVK
jgi:hypothetical protein